LCVPEKEKLIFFKVVSLINYGDDNLKYVAKEYRNIYTSQNIQAFAEALALEITSANKDEVLSFKNVLNVQFLKRTPVWDPERKIVVGKLSFNTIPKMLAWTNSDVEESEWNAMVLDQAARELSFHSLDLFKDFCQIYDLTLDYEVLRDTALQSTGWGKDRIVLTIDDAQAEDTYFKYSYPCQGLQNN